MHARGFLGLFGKFPYMGETSHIYEPSSSDTRLATLACSQPKIALHHLCMHMQCKSGVDWATSSTAILLSPLVMGKILSRLFCSQVTQILLADA